MPRDDAGSLRPASPVVHDAHLAGLAVHAWTFRAENRFLPPEFRIGADPDARGDVIAEYELFLISAWTGSSPTTRTPRWPRLTRCAGIGIRLPWPDLCSEGGRDAAQHGDGLRLVARVPGASLPVWGTSLSVPRSFCGRAACLGADFTRLWTASAVSNIGDGVTMVAGPLLVARSPPIRPRWPARARCRGLDRRRLVWSR